MMNECDYDISKNGCLSGAYGSGIAETCPISTIKRTSAKIICLTVRTPVDFLD